MPGVDNDLNGRLALITGASGGIGAAVAKDLWAQGCDLALTCWNGLDRVKELVGQLEDAPARPDAKISVHRIDMGTEDDGDFDYLFAEVEQHQGRHPDILVANAGYGGERGKRKAFITDVDLADLDYFLRVNLRAPFALVKHCVPHMAARRWGRLVFVSSIAAHGGGINGPHYAASKAGLTGMMKNLATRHAQDGITSNDVAPAMIGDTGMIRDASAVEGTPGDVKNIPVGRLGVPQEAANVVTMLCRTGYMTGQSILLSGGLK